MSDSFEQLVARARRARGDDQLDIAEQGYADAARATENDRLRAYALRHLSDVASDRGRFDSALAAGLDALALYRADPQVSQLDLANALRVTARALKGAGRDEEGAQAWREARNFYSACGVGDGVEDCDRNLR